jgi:hypothetical protein
VRRLPLAAPPPHEPLRPEEVAVLTGEEAGR